jgi:hypothetical protein
VRYGDACPFLLESAGALRALIGGVTYSDLYATHLDWLAKTRHFSLGDLLDRTLEELTDMLDIVDDHERAIEKARRDRRRQ